MCCVLNRNTFEGHFSLKRGSNALLMIGNYVNKSIYRRPVRILILDEFPERRSSKLIFGIVMDYTCIINLLFTLLQVVANDKIISRVVIMILIEAGGNA